MSPKYLLFLGLALTLNGYAEEQNKQCEMIASLTGDYFHHKQAGKSKDEVRESLRPEFANEAFIRVADLAINLAFTFPDEHTEASVEQEVFKGCTTHQR